VIQEKKFDSGDVVLNYAEGPDNGPPLLLLHGFTGYWRFYNPIIPYLQSRWHIYATDLRGHGKSGRTPGKYGLGYYYKDLQQFIDEKINEPVIIIGHSKGGVLSCMLASRNMEKTRAVILLDPPLYIREKSKNLLPWWEAYHKMALKEGSIHEKLNYIENLRVDTGNASVKFTDRFDQSSVLAWAMNKVDPSALDVKINSIRNENDADLYYDWYEPEKVLRMIDCPVLLVQAGIGDTLSDSDVKEAKEWLKDVIHIKLPSLDHGLGLSQWNHTEIMRVLSTFLESIR
jgi:pimeloyl-ACP methyl ester carboxylesterase